MAVEIALRHLKNFFDQNRMYVPMFNGLAIVLLFHVAVPHLIESLGPESTTCHRRNFPVPGSVFKLNAEMYAGMALLIVLFVVQLFVIIFSVRTICNRRVPRTHPLYWVSMKKYVVVSAKFAVPLACKQIYDIICRDNDSIFDPVFNFVRCHGLPSDVYYFMTWVKHFVDITAIVTVVLLLAAICALVPTFTWDRRSSTVDDAVNELAYQMRGLRYLFYLSVIYLVIGVSFVLVFLQWLLSYVPNHIDLRSTASGIVLYSAIFYIMLLSVVVVPVTLRLARAASQVAGRRTPWMTEASRQKWLLDNGLSFSFGHGLRHAMALLSPFLVPVLSELWLR